MNGDLATDDVFDLVGDQHVRDILRATSREPKCVKEMSRELGVARSTVYRRLDSLVEAGLVRERTRPASDGNHHAVYEAVVDRLTVDIDDGRLDCEIHPDDDATARLTKVWEGLREV